VWWLIHTFYCYFFGFLKEEKDLKNALVHICATWAFFKFPGPCIIVILY